MKNNKINTITRNIKFMKIKTMRSMKLEKKNWRLKELMMKMKNLKKMMITKKLER